jgi:hypothetical protein
MVRSRISILVHCALVLTAVLGQARTVYGQRRPNLELPLLSLRDIASDFDAGRNLSYCYHGQWVDSLERVHVDSESIVATVSACDGVGIGFISRLTDPTIVMETLRAVIESFQGFRVVSAFYKTDVIEIDGQTVRAARAVSVMRPSPVTPARVKS